MSGITADFSGAIKKTDTLLHMDKAVKKNLQQWSSETVRELKDSAASMQKSGRGMKTGHLARSIGFKIEVGDGHYIVKIGTGMAGNKDVVYARILDKGGTIKPIRAKYLTIPFPGVKGNARSYKDTFFITSKSGNLILASREWKKARGGVNYWQTGKITPLFLLKKEVTMPAFRWFSKVWEPRIRIIDQDYMNDKAILKTAESMAVGGSSNA